MCNKSRNEFSSPSTDDFSEDYSFDVADLPADKVPPIRQEQIDDVIELIEGIGSSFAEMIEGILGIGDK